MRKKIYIMVSIIVLFSISFGESPDELLERAKAGDKEAQYEIGFYYYEKNQHEKAYKWFKKSALQDVEKSQNMLGKLYYYGKGVPEDYKKAAYWFEKSADWGNAESQLYTGHIYYNGMGVTKNIYKAFKYFREAAYNGEGEAQGKVGLMYLHGIGVEKNKEEARYWFKQCLENTNTSKTMKINIKELWNKYNLGSY
ncbi:MAG: sel1 repeat family protein [Candidatus Mcinerneyibacterium aminivorans]|uniref:Sel1 repeat family protein n=1 Tax=Candidatus Mcinerneyibacterium aminivorans TaxID=2703815 RepID=A0A5D0MG66_9BACT|nr:MAG: sel1 repeat family protein [Candidatus Mcinerneyibacterium aminivorans]